MSPPTVLEEFTEKLVALGESEVRAKLLQRVWNTPRKEWAAEWLEFEEKKRASASAARAEAREEDAITIAREANTIALAAAVSASDANDIARSARKISFIAAIAAIVAAIAAVIAAKLW